MCVCMFSFFLLSESSRHFGVAFIVVRLVFACACTDAIAWLPFTFAHL